MQHRIKAKFHNTSSDYRLIEDETLARRKAAQGLPKVFASRTQAGVRGQSSIEFLLAIPIIFLITIFIVGQFSTATKTTVAMATAKESFYEKTLDFNESVLVKKIEYTVCDLNTLKLNFITIPNNISSSGVDLDTVQNESIATSGFPDVNITVNETTPICP